MDALRKSVLKLRADAIERGMNDLAVAYGWSAIRLGIECLEVAQKTPASREASGGNRLIVKQEGMIGNARANASRSARRNGPARALV